MSTQVLFRTTLTILFFYSLVPLYTIAQETPRLTDPEIAHIGVAANQIDIDFADLAIEKSENADVINFAQTMKRDHHVVIQKATDLVTELGVTPQINDVSKSLQKEAKKTYKALSRKKSAEFDKAYIDNEVKFHKVVINTLEKVLKPMVSNEELEGFLESILPALKTHLEHAEMVQKQFR